MTLQEFLATNQHPLKNEIAALRKIIQAAKPELSEQVKWNAPSFCYNGDDRITFNLSKKDAVRLIFHRGAKSKPMKINKPLIEIESSLLEWPSFDRAVMTFQSLKEINDNKTALTKIVDRWIDVTSNISA